MRFIQVGVGGFGTTWLPRLQRDTQASLVALADSDEGALAAASEATGVSQARCYTDYAEALDSVDADAVLNVTPPGVHCEVALAALERGLHVLTEKPLSDTMAAGRRMVEAAEKAGRVLMVSQNYRFHPWVQTMRQVLASGEFGRPDNMVVRFARAPRFDGSFRLKMEHPLVADMSIHHFDLMRAVSGQDPESVYAETWKPEWSWFDHDPCAVAIFDFADGMKAVYEGSWVARGRETPWEGYWGVECADALIELRDQKVHILSAERPGQDTEVELAQMPCVSQDYSLLEFQQAVAEEREPATSARDNLKSLAMVFAAMESASSGTRVRIDSVIES